MVSHLLSSRPVGAWLRPRVSAALMAAAVGWAAPSWAQKAPSVAPGKTPVAVEVNKASQAELEMVKGIGPQLSAQLLSIRAKQPYKDWSDLIQRTSGVGTKRAAKLSDGGLQVNGASYTPGAAVGKTRAAAKPGKAASQ